MIRKVAGYKIARFRENLLHKMAKITDESGGVWENWHFPVDESFTQVWNKLDNLGPADQARVRQLMEDESAEINRSHAPWVGLGALAGGTLGGYLGSKKNHTLLGILLGGTSGAVLGGVGSRMYGRIGTNAREREVRKLIG